VTLAETHRMLHNRHRRTPLKDPIKIHKKR